MSLLLYERMSFTAMPSCTTVHVSVSVCQCINQCKAASVCQTRAKKHLTARHFLFIEESEVKNTPSEKIVQWLKTTAGEGESLVDQ